MLAEDVADAANGVDEARLAGRLRLPPQVADVDVERVRHHAEVEAPDVPEDDRARQDAARVAQEELEQVELDRRELDRPAGATNDARVGIEPEVGEAENVRPGEDVSPSQHAQAAANAREAGGHR